MYAALGMYIFEVLHLRGSEMSSQANSRVVQTLLNATVEIRFVLSAPLKLNCDAI